MTVFFDKARDHWRYDFWHAGKRYTGYCDDPRTGEAARTKTQAKHVEDIIRGAVKAQPATAKPSAPTGYSVAEAFAEYADEARHKRSWSNIKRYIRELVAYFGPDSLLSDVDEDAIASYVAWARRQPVLRFAGGRGRPRDAWSDQGRLRGEGTINRYLNCLRAVLNRAHQHRKVTAVPKVGRLKEPDDLPNPIDDASVDLILSLAPTHLQRLILLCVHTGMRQQETLRCRMGQVSWDMSA